MPKTFEKLSMYQAQVFMEDFKRFHAKHKGNQRIGQMAYNVLDMSHDVNVLLGSESDPFYQDDKLPAFIETVFAHDCVSMMHQFFAKYKKP